MSPVSSKNTSCVFNIFIQAFGSGTPRTLDGGKIHNSAETRQGLNFPKNLRSISLLSTTGKLLEKLIVRTIQKTLRKETYWIHVSLPFEQITVRHFNV
jgi:hypothetical protein